MILADTSVWIKALSRKPPFEEELTDLLIRGQIAGHDLVFGELLIRDKGGAIRAAVRRRSKITNAWIKLPLCLTTPSSNWSTSASFTAKASGGLTSTSSLPPSSAASDSGPPTRACTGSRKNSASRTPARAEARTPPTPPFPPPSHRPTHSPRCGARIAASAGTRFEAATYSTP